MSTTTHTTSITHYVVTLRGSDRRVSVWGLETFRQLQSEKRIATVHSITSCPRP